MSNMRTTIIYALIVLITMHVTTVEMQATKFLPNDNECGVLRADQFFNLEKKVEPNEFPWMATLKSENGNRVECVSVLISKQYILTVAHCLMRAPAPDTIYLGSCDTGDNSKCLKETRFEKFIHPKYEEAPQEFEYDIALIRLFAPILFSDYISPICLPNTGEGTIDFGAQHLAFTGLSYLNKKKGKLFLLIMGLPQCVEFYEGLNLDEKAMCANTCDNGSKYILGSALMGTRVKFSQPQQYYLVGLLTSGKGHDCDITPDIFRRIDHHMNWISQTISSVEDKKISMRLLLRISQFALG